MFDEMTYYYVGFCIIWQIWSISPGHFIKHKPPISETTVYYLHNNIKIEFFPNHSSQGKIEIYSDGLGNQIHHYIIVCENIR